MHGLAVALQEKGYQVTGSDDKIYEPSRSHLAHHGLLPAQEGWHPDKIHQDLSFVIVGMHALADNPELLRVQELGLKLYSYPSFIREYCADKERVVVAGSHGKTTVVAMIMHVLSQVGLPFDYVVGAQVPGFSNTVRLSDAPLVIIEGDEYPSSPWEKEGKLCLYDHHIGLITGVEWDHINFYPQLEDYAKVFETFADKTPKGGALLYNEGDDLATIIGSKSRPDVRNVPYDVPLYVIEDGHTYLLVEKERIRLKIFGRHNVLNLQGATKLLHYFCIDKAACYAALSTFEGVYHRLSLLREADEEHGAWYVDTAHAPSKVAATVHAVKTQYPERKLAAVLELYSFSSLDPAFTAQYQDSLRYADLALVYINPEVLAQRSGHEFREDALQTAFRKSDLRYTTHIAAISTILKASTNKDWNFLFMSLGNFGGFDIADCIKEVVES